MSLSNKNKWYWRYHTNYSVMIIGWHHCYYHTPSGICTYFNVISWYRPFILYNKHNAFLTLQNSTKSRKKYFPGTTWTVILSAGSNLQPHTAVLSVEKGLIRQCISFMLKWTRPILLPSDTRYHLYWQKGSERLRHELTILQNVWDF